MKIDCYLDTAKILKECGFSDGRLQNVLDSEVIKYLRQTMPMRNGLLIANTYQERPGLVVVRKPYAHYMNEGVLYVMDNGKGAYYSPSYGYWSKRAKKHPSSRKLNYHGSPDRGAHFVERTCKGHLEDILKAVKSEVRK